MITLKTLMQATAQEVFDQVAEHLLDQNERSVYADNDPDDLFARCSYRNHAGLKCAAGCLISDNEYDPSWDNGSGGTWTMLVGKELVPDNHTKLIRDLQIIHDKTLPADWGIQLKSVARQYDLEFKF